MKYATGLDGEVVIRLLLRVVKSTRATNLKKKINYIVIVYYIIKIVTIKWLLSRKNSSYFFSNQIHQWNILKIWDI
jgi:hypothetical protein